MPTVHRNAIARSLSFALAAVRNLNDHDAPNPGVDCPSVGRKATRGDALCMGRLDCVIVATRSALRQTASVSKI
jgi:hypothetical protein